MKAYERLLNYVVVRTPSDENSETVPSSTCQFDLARLLEAEMKELGLTDVILDDQCYLYGKLPATEGLEDKPAIGFIAHMDTVSDFCDHDIKPIVTENYDGGELKLGTSDTVLSPKNFPHLESLKGRTLITSDGTTVLGADDKAGVAEIMTLAEALLAGEIPHGPISIGFTPDEEIGEGPDFFDVPGFDAEFAYTVDGGTEGEIEFENFNAAGAKFTVTGFNIHPGGAKDTMINAIAVASEIQSLLPEAESPRNTEGYEGFYHLTSMSGDVAHAESEFIIRDHDAEKFAAKEENLRRIEKEMNEKYEIISSLLPCLYTRNKNEDLRRIKAGAQTKPNDCLLFVIFYYICAVK